MNRSKIRHLSYVSGYAKFAAAEFENIVHVFEIGNPQPLSTIQTVLSSGGDRLQIVPKFDLVLAGAYDRYGVECYSIDDGLTVWKRKDLRKIQRIYLNPVNDEISCLFSDRAGVVLDIRSGDTLRKYHGVRDIYFCHDIPLTLEMNVGDPYRIKIQDKLFFKIEALSFAILDAVLTPEFIAISEAGGCTRIFSVDEKKLIGRFDPPKGYHILRLCYCRDSGLFIGFLWGYEKTRMCSIVHISTDGSLLNEIVVPEGIESVFLPDRKILLCEYGFEIDWISGQIMDQYNFPMVQRIVD